MSMLPLLLNMAEDLSDFAPVDYDFGLGIYPQEIRRVQQRCPRLYMAYPRRKHCPYALEKKKSGGTGKVIKDKENYSVGKDGFQVCMDVQQFQPNELTVKTVENTVVIEGKHDERDDEHGSISRHFVRKYSLPAGYDPKEVVSTLSSDGILTVKAPPPPAKGLKNKKERMIQIQETGPAHLSVKENPKEGEQKKGEEAKDDKMED